MVDHEITRQELYDLVWGEPLSILAKRFEISDVRLGKICVEADIPKPGVGYWAKRQSGKSTVQPPLPQRKLGQTEQVVFGEYRNWGTEEDKHKLLSEPLPAPPYFPENLDVVAERARKIADKAPIRKSLSNPHPIIAKLLAKDNERKEKQISSPFGFSWNPPLFDSRPGRRRLLILNSLFLAFSYCACKPSTPRSDVKDLHVRVGDQSILFELDTIEEQRKRVTHRAPATETEVEKLRLEISWWKAPSEITLQWEDRPDFPLENQIKDIVTGFLIAGEWMYRTAAVYRHELLVERKNDLEESIRRGKEEELRLEKERIEKIEEEKRQKLFSDAADWRRASDIRAYVEAALAKSQEGLPTQDVLQLREWARWAQAEANLVDPLCRPNVLE